MDLKKTWRTILVFALVAVVVWAGFSVYFKITDVSVDANTNTYITYLPSKFDMVGFTKVVERTKLLPVLPSSFRALIVAK